LNDQIAAGQVFKDLDEKEKELTKAQLDKAIQFGSDVCDAARVLSKKNRDFLGSIA